MVLTKSFKNSLVKAELDTSGEYAVLRVDVDAAVLGSEREEYAREGQRIEEEMNMPNYEYNMRRREFRIIDPDEYADRNIKIEIESGLKEAKEWAREKTKKKFKIVFTQE